MAFLDKYAPKTASPEASKQEYLSMPTKTSTVRGKFLRKPREKIKALFQTKDTFKLQQKALEKTQPEKAGTLGTGPVAIQKAIAGLVKDRKEPVSVRLPYSDKTITTRQAPLVTGTADLIYRTLELPGKFAITLLSELRNVSEGEKAQEFDVGVDLRKLGFPEKKYQTAALQTAQQMMRGKNIWEAGVNVLLDKGLDIAFGAGALVDIAKLSTNMLLRGGVEARIEAQNIIESMRTKQKEVFNRLRDVPVSEREKVMAPITDAINKAQQTLKDLGSPTKADYARVNASRYTEVLGRETPIKKGFLSKFGKPDIKLKTPAVTREAIDQVAKSLPGYRERAGQPAPLGASMREVEPVGFGKKPVETKFPGRTIELKDQKLSHGTDQEFEKFDITKAKTGAYPGLHFVETPEAARAYGKNLKQPAISGKIFDVGSSSEEAKILKELDTNEAGLREKLINEGYDGIKRGTEYSIFNEKAIKDVFLETPTPTPPTATPNTPGESIPVAESQEVVPKPEVPSPDTIPPEIDPVQKIMVALREAKPIRGKQEKIYSKERSKRLGKAIGVGKQVKGQKGLYAQLGQLKGEISKVEFETLKGKLDQPTIDSLFDIVRNHPSLYGFEQINAQVALGKLFGEFGGEVPTNSELALLSKIFHEDFIKELMSKRPITRKVLEGVLEAINIPRSLLSSFDLSFGFRQGEFAAARYRKEFFNSWTKQFKMFGSEKAYNLAMDSIEQDALYPLARKAGISFTDVGKIITEREERFMSSWAEKIPGVGKVIRASGRAYTAFANKFRFDIFKRLVKDAENLKLDPQNDEALLHEIATFINTATGRGPLPVKGFLGNLEQAATALNAIFFSPRLMASRLTLLNPIYYIKADPFVRKEALKSLLSFASAISAVLGLAAIAGAEVGTDSNSSDFGKIKIGNTRIDIAGGFQQYIRMASQLISGKYVSSITGKEITLGEGYKPLTRGQILGRQIQSKEAPILSFITDLLKQQDYTGQPVNVQKEIIDLFIPMIIQDSIEIAKDDPSLLPLAVLGVFGFSIQNYGSQPLKPTTKSSSLLPGKKLPGTSSLPGAKKLPK